jgi:hypothetical protein
MSAFRRVLVLVLVAMLSLAPALAEARAGYSSGAPYSSLGSRGSRTFDSTPGAAPIQRSVTPNSPSSPSLGSSWGNPGYSQPLYAGSRGSFWHGLAGGLFGAWLGHALFGGFGGYGYGGWPMHTGGLFGTLLMFLILFWVGRTICRGAFGFAPGIGSPVAYSRGGAGPVMGGYQPVSRPLQAGLAVDQRDFDAFGQVFMAVQAAWTRNDVEALRRHVTPEMLAYFAEMLANNASQGVANRVENVQLLQGEPRETWREGVVDYATCFLRWSAIDYTHRLDRGPNDPGFLVDGDPRRPTECREFWTFRRTGGGRWILSAIQQVA